MNSPIGRTREGHPTLRVHVQPRSARNRCCGLHDSSLKLMVTAPPVDHQANKAVRLFLAELMGVKAAGVVLKSGEFSRKKVFCFTTLSEQELTERLQSLLH
ncbi:MAG: DUF167 family protein [Desulfofustis sp.]|nr:DUF167 family protein [Desulfofustis sp.]